MARLFLECFVLVVFLMSIQARNKSPLIDDDGTRPRKKAAECVFGKQVRELGSQWIPDLGVPIGVLYCMKCECVPQQRKRRIVARVQCRSIKNECPETTCEEPVLQPGRCCKTCPGSFNNPDVIQDIVPQNGLDEEEKNSKHYAALLTGRSSLVFKNEKLAPSNANKNNVVATGRFTFHKKNLHYSFYISDKAARPRTLQFGDSDGNILEEFTLSKPGGLVSSQYQNATRKVCGIWRRLPREYRRLLKQERLVAVLIWGVKDQAEFTLSGQVMRYVSLGTELFSSLLDPAPGTDSSTMAGAGGTAIVSISTSVPTSIHIAVIFNGLFADYEYNKIPINVTLSMEDKKFILNEVVMIKKPKPDLNLIELSSPVTSADLRLLTRGRLLLSVGSISQPEALRLNGNVVTKATCELFQTTLASSSSDRNANRFGTSGLAWLYLNHEGALVYNVQIDNLRAEQMPAAITLIDVSTKRRTELEDLTPSFSNGWANGTVDKLSPKVLEPLYSGNLAVNVATQTEISLIKGRLTAKPVADARDSPVPFLLKRENYSLPTSAVGLAWVSVDNDCHLQYELSMSGLGDNSRRFELQMDFLPMLAPGAPVITRYLDDFQGNQADGSPINTLNREELNRLDTGVTFLKVKDRESKIVLLTATIQHVLIPSACRPALTDNNVMPALISNDQGQDQPFGHCFIEGKFYQEEAQWTSADDPCTMCYCQNGVTKCDTMTCPDVQCPYNSTILPGECCPICLNGNQDAESYRNAQPLKCIFNGKPYSPGSKFYPFLIPNGFDTCTECTCDAVYLEIKCTRKNEKTCCKNCPSETIFNDTMLMGDDHVPSMDGHSMPRKEMPTQSPQQTIDAGGCRNYYNPNKPYPNGSEYHPLIDSLGEYKCVTCKCQDGNQSCKRQLCDKSACEKIFRMKRKGVAISGDETCCSLRECKKYRHKRNNYRPPLNQIQTS